MGRRSKNPKAPTSAYHDAEGNELVLRDVLSPGTVGALERETQKAAATTDDLWQRRQELLFERLAVSWTIAGLDPLTKQAELLGRFRMASTDERAWLRETIAAHIREKAPELEELL